MGYLVSKFYDAYDGLAYDYYSTSIIGYINNCRKHWGWKHLKYLHITKAGARLHCNRLNKRLMKK